MPAPKSLYDVLHEGEIHEPEPVEPEVSAQDFCKHIVASPEFRMYLMNGILEGSLPGAVIGRIMDHAWGKPVERLEVKDTTDMDDLPIEAVQERIDFLQDTLRRLQVVKISDAEQAGVH